MPANLPARLARPAGRRVTDVVAAKFPDRDRDDMETTVRNSYQMLAEDSRIIEHLAVLVQHEAIDQLHRAADRSPRPVRHAIECG
jgi:hypothetical protein